MRFASSLAAVALLSAALPAAECPSRYAPVDGHRVHYRSCGSGPVAVVLIHGWTCDGSFWREQVPALQARYRVLNIDLPGHGASDKPDIAYTQDLFVRAVDAVMRHAGVSRAVLAGHSMGGVVVRRFARAHPDRAIALVSVDSTSRRRPAAGEEEKATAGLAGFVNQLRGPDYQAAAARVIDSMFVASTPAALREDIKKRMLATPRRVALSALENTIRPEILWDDRPIRVPMLEIVAHNPRIPPDYEDFVRGFVPRLEYRVVDGVGHFLMMERPAEFNRLILDFLDRVAR